LLLLDKIGIILFCARQMILGNCYQLLLLPAGDDDGTLDDDDEASIKHTRFVWGLLFSHP
jgi:hypothetical protein